MLKNYNVILFLYFIILACPISNAITSIITGIVILTILLNLKKLNFTIVPKIILKSILSFIFLLIVASVATGEIKNISRTFNFLYWMLPFFLVFFLLQLTNNKKVIAYAFAAALLITAVPAIYDIVFGGMKRSIGIYNQPNHLASMLDIILPVMVMYSLQYFKDYKANILIKILFLAIAAAGVAALILSGSRGGWFGVGIGLILMLILYFARNLSVAKLISMFLLTVCISGFAASYLYQSTPDILQRRYDNERLLLLESSYNMWNDNKLFGVGLSKWAEEYENNYKLLQAKEKLDMPHNILAYFFSTAGLFGGIGYCIFIGGIFIYLIKELKKGDKNSLYALAMLWVLFAINIHGMVDIGLNNKFVMRLFSGTLGLTAALCSNY